MLGLSVVRTAWLLCVKHLEQGLFAFSRACGTELMEHGKILGIFPTLLAAAPSRVVIMVVSLFRAAFAVCFWNTPGFCCSADIHLNILASFTDLCYLRERSLSQKKQKKYLFVKGKLLQNRKTIL